MEEEESVYVYLPVIWGWCLKINTSLVSEVPEPLGAQRWIFFPWASYSGNRPPHCSCQQWLETDPTVAGLCSAACPLARTPRGPPASVPQAPWDPGLLCPQTCAHHREPPPPASTSSPTPGGQNPTAQTSKEAACSWHDEKAVSLHVKGERLRYIKIFNCIRDVWTSFKMRFYLLQVKTNQNQWPPPPTLTPYQLHTKCGVLA